MDAVRQALIAGERSGEATPFDFDDFGSGCGIIEVGQGQS
ncbi:type II toxin-antitoxin system ParD family antitoxin [Microtetraspora sp. AC03309]|nr:type II toxin-antitoxin system ParD family antitoxin [Microtetraspora sp. AC03309]